MLDIYYTITVIFAFLILYIVNKGIYSTKFKGKQEIKEYQWFVRSIEVFLLVDASWGLVQRYTGWLCSYVDALAYNITMIFTVLMCCRYVSKFLELQNRSGKILNIFGVGFFIFDVLMIIVNFFTPVVFWIDETGEYHTGIMREIGMVILVLVFVTMAITSLIASRNATGLVWEKIIAIFFFASFITAALAVQVIFPLFPCFSLGLVAGVIILFVQVHVAEQYNQLEEISKLKTMTDAANIGIWELVTQDGRAPFLRTDGKMKEILGLPIDSDLTDEEVNEYLKTRIYPDDISAFLEYDAKLTSGERAECTYRWNHPTLGLRYMRCGGTVTLNSDGKIVRTGYHSDVTEQVKTEKELQMSIAASKTKTIFLQNMSHEIRTPLNAIFGFSQLLGLPDGSLTEEEKEQYNRIISNSYFMLDMLLNDILDSADIQHGNYRMNMSEFNVNEVCKNAMMSVEFRCPDGVKMQFSSDLPDDYVMTSDPQRIQQILVNFLSNACKHTEQGEINLHISDKKNIGAVTFSVSDTGTGIPKESAENIFSRYTKLDQNVDGHGLGLNICNTLSNKLGGKVYVDTTYTNGARFVFELKEHTSAVQA